MNYENFCKVLAKIEADPSCWDQRSFYGNCFLGIAADMAGGRRKRGAFDRLAKAAEFLDLELIRGCGQVGAADLTLDHFRRIRYVEATRRFMARAA